MHEFGRDAGNARTVACAELEVPRKQQVKADQRPHPYENEQGTNRNRCHRRSIIKPLAFPDRCAGTGQGRNRLWTMNKRDCHIDLP